MKGGWPHMGSTNYPAIMLSYAKDHALPVAALRAAGVVYLTESETKECVGKFKFLDSNGDEDEWASPGMGVPFLGTGTGQVRALDYGAKPKFKFPVGASQRMYLGPLKDGDWDAIRRDPDEEVCWCEGPLKALCLTWRGIPAFSFGGLDGWGTAHKPNPDLAAFRWRERPVLLLVDSDASTKVEARRSIQRLADYLTSLGARVRLLLIPALDGDKTDVNDYVAARGIEALQELEPIEVPADWTAVNATRELNVKHAYIPKHRAEVLVEVDDPDFPGTLDIAIQRMSDFMSDYSNQRVLVGTKKNGDPIYRTKAEVWKDDKLRREVRRIWFTPGKPWGLDPKTGEFNLWQGWAVEPHKPDKKHSWQLLQDHIHWVLANGNAAHAEYILNWLAHGVQHPATLPEVALVLIGGEGTGKGIVARAYGHLFGRHFLPVTTPGMLNNKHNDLMKDKLLVFADENFYAGDHTAANAMKTAITEPSMLIEPKFVDAYKVPNYRRFIISSNEMWVVAADSDARRYAVFRVSEARKDDLAYFKAIADQLNSGGYAAMLYDLRTRPLAGFDPRHIPSTEALLEQKKLTWDPITKWWFDKLVEGTFGSAAGTRDWEGFCTKKVVLAEVREKVGKRDDDRALETRIGILLRAMCPRVKDARPTIDGKRRRAFTFPSLGRCRKAFEEYCRTQIDWEHGGLASNLPNLPNRQNGRS